MMSKPAMDEIQHALNILVAKGLIEVIGTRAGQPVYRATIYSEGKNASTRKPSAAS
jgi:hypothetical protein